MIRVERKVSLRLFLACMLQNLRVLTLRAKIQGIDRLVKGKSVISIHAADFNKYTRKQKKIAGNGDQSRGRVESRWVINSFMITEREIPEYRIMIP